MDIRSRLDQARPSVRLPVMSSEDQVIEAGNQELDWSHSLGTECVSIIAPSDNARGLRGQDSPLRPQPVPFSQTERRVWMHGFSPGTSKLLTEVHAELGSSLSSIGRIDAPIKSSLPGIACPNESDEPRFMAQAQLPL